MTSATIDPGAGSRGRTKAWNQALWIGSRAGGPIVLVVLVIIFWATMPNTFGTKANFQSMVSAQAVPGILALGLLFPLVAGEFDFSGGAVASAAAVFLVVLSGTHGWSWPLASVVVIGGATAVGAFNGFLIAYLNYSSFVTTLAVSGVISGIALAQSNGLTLYKGIPQSFLRLGSNQALSVPLPVVYLAVVFVLVAFFLRQTAWGRYNEAVGKGRAAARLAGVNVRSHIFVSFVASAALAAVAGLVLVARLGSAQPNGGSAFTLSAFAAAFLGATMFRPGFFNAPGTIVAILLIAVGINGLTLGGVPSYIEQIFTGGVLLVAVGLSQIERFSRRT